MENSIQKYELTQNGRKYILSTQIYENKIRLTCVETNKENPPVFVGDYPLLHLRQLSSAFNSISTIQEALYLLNKTIEDQKVKVDNKGDSINIFFFLLNQGENPVLALKPNVEVIYSPARYLPTRKVFLPPVTIKRPTIYLENDSNGVEPNLIYKTPAPKIDKLTLPLTPRRQAKNIYQNEVIQNQNYLFGSPKREQIDVSIPGSPSSPLIQYTTTSSSRNKNYLYQNNIPIDPIIFSTNDDQRIIELQNLTSKMKIEHEILKNESSKLINTIQNLKNEIEILKAENEKLRQNNGALPNGNEIHEITILKQEIERLRNELANLKNEKNNEFEEYKKIKEDEINLNKSQIEELLQKISFLEQENNNLKLKLQEIVNKYNIKSQEGNLDIVRGEIIENNDELELLTKKISKDHKKITLNLLYKATVDSDSAEAFHRKCDKAKSSIVLVKSGIGKRFGGFTSCDWSGESIDKKDDNAFVFSLDKMQIYDIIPGEDAIGCYPKYGPVFLGCQIRIFDEAFTRGGTTFQKELNYNTQEDFELNGGEREFEVKEIEVYGVELE